MATDPLLLEHDAEAAEYELAGKLLDELNSPEVPDPEAPYGFTRDGKPRGKPGPKAAPAAGSSGAGRSRSRPRGRTKHSPPRGTPAAPKAKAAAGPDYAAGVRGILQMVAAPLAMYGLRDKVYMFDAATISLHADSVGAGFSEGADSIPQLQAVLDRIMTVGPWGAVLSPVIAMGAQLMANHGLIPAGQMGTLTREELMEYATGLQEQAA